MATYKLKENNPVSVRLADLMAYAEELNLSIDFSHSTVGTFLTDTLTGQTYSIKDIENEIPLRRFPAHSEYKITYDK
jgi:hypothetical protein